LTDANAATVGSICQRLDGIPLAIELAVPRLRVLSLEQLARGLDERFRLLTAGSRTALPRQQTLHALIDWSYALLSDAEKTLLGRLSVFCGNAALASITAVVAGAETPWEEVSDLLLSLVEKSLVHADPAGSECRYGLLESTRYYASEKLADRPRMRRRHAEHFAARLAQATAAWEPTPKQQWIGCSQPDVDHLRGHVARGVGVGVRTGRRRRGRAGARGAKPCALGGAGPDPGAPALGHCGARQSPQRDAVGGNGAAPLLASRRREGAR